MSIKRILGYLVITVMVIGFPAVSYVYLKDGYNFRKALIDSVSDYGEAPSLAGLTSVQGKLPDSLNGNLVLVSWLTDPQSSSARTLGVTLDSLADQFENSPHLYLTTISPPGVSEANIHAWRDEFGLPQVGDLLHLLQADSAFIASAVNDYALSEVGITELGQEPIVTLINAKGHIIKHYDLLQRDETTSLVRYVAAFIPLPEEEDIILERDNEL
ncbi:MAG: hypothetical protein AAF741_04765 [Bacteroidota bacterium]